MPVGAQGVLSNHLTSGARLGPKVRAVRSGDFKHIYFVSTELGGPGLEDDGEVATWAMNRFRPSPARPLPVVYSVGGMAHEFSDWEHGEDVADMTIADDGYEESQDCL